MADGELAPFEGVVEASWELDENQTGTVTNSQATNILELGTSYFTLDCRVECRDRDELDVWKAFFTRRRFRAFSFTMWPTLRPRPRDITVLSDAGLTLDNVDTDNWTVTLSGLAAGAVIHEGDPIGYRTAANGYWIGHAMFETTADGSGVATIPVLPVPRAPHASTPAPQRIRPLGEFKLTEKPRIPEKFDDFPVSFKARQIIT